MQTDIYTSGIGSSTCNRCKTGKNALPDMCAQFLRACVYISGNARVSVLQLICNTSNTLKSAKTYQPARLSYVHIETLLILPGVLACTCT